MTMFIPAYGHWKIATGTGIVEAMQIILTPEILLAAYAQGLFPMAESANTPYVHWYCPKMRGQLPIEGLHVPRKLAKAVRRMELGGKAYEIKINTAFEDVIRACAASRADRPETWINEPIIKAYCALHRQGHAHSVECWQGGVLIGGLYGVSLGGAFFGESMFSYTSGASKACLVHLAARLWRAGFKILDTQFVNDHLLQFGIYELEYEDYMAALAPSLLLECDFTFACEEKELMNAYLKIRQE